MMKPLRIKTKTFLVFHGSSELVQLSFLQIQSTEHLKLSIAIKSP